MYEIEFVGGPVDGQLMWLPELVNAYLVPWSYRPRTDDVIVPAAQPGEQSWYYALVRDFKGRPAQNRKGVFQYKFMNM